MGLEGVGAEAQVWPVFLRRADRDPGDRRRLDELLDLGDVQPLVTPLDPLG
jgi:hypothetical protein